MSVTPEQRVLCFYHGTDFDGYCSAVVVAHAHGWDKVEWYPMDYGDAFPYDDIDKNCIVYMVDFSLRTYEEMLKIQEKCLYFVWVDHHETPIKQETQYLIDHGFHEDQVEIPGCRDYQSKLGACELTWNYLFNPKQIPNVVRLLGQYDVWNLALPDCLAFQYGMRSYMNMNPKECGLAEAARWQELFSENSHSTVTSKVISAGERILQYEKAENQKKANKLSFHAQLGSYKTLAMNVPMGSTNIFDDILNDHPDTELLVLFWFRKGLWEFKVAPVEGVPIDAGTLCEQFGGGGKKGVGGFLCEDWKDPFETIGEW